MYDFVNEVRRKIYDSINSVTTSLMPLTILPK